MQAYRLQTLSDCSLAIGRYPSFQYDARGGGAVGGCPDGLDGPIRFPPEALAIPPLSTRTTRWLGLPLPPGLTITIEPALLEGEFNSRCGSLTLQFQARFQFQAAGLRRPAPLWIDARLSTGPAAVRVGQSRWGAQEGSPLDADGAALLVGVADVQPSGSAWLDRFLGLPDQALARLRLRLELP
jgi:hypothetical protein